VAISAKYLRPLAPYFIGDPNDDGEQQMACPLHVDNKRSASLNIETGQWYCFAGCGGGSVSDLLGRKAEWNPPPSGVASSKPTKRRGSGVQQELPSEKQIRAWTEILIGNATALRRFRKARGLSTAMIRKAELGFSEKQNAYTIPVRNAKRELQTVRFYNLRPREGQRKFWHIAGHAGPFIFPEQMNQSSDVIIICEGELDALLSIQAGYPALTRTGSAGTWQPSWNHLFKGKTVLVCHDMDVAGQKANLKVAKSVAKVAKEVRIITLPYAVTEKHGKDITDFWRDRGGTRNEQAQAEWQALIEGAELHSTVAEDIQHVRPEDASPIDASNADHLGRPLRLTLTVKGRGRAGYAIPRKITATCDSDAGTMCKICPLYEVGHGEIEISKSDPLALRMIGSSDDDLEKTAKKKLGIPNRCPKVEFDMTKRQSVQVLFARPPVGYVNGANGTHLNSIDSLLKITSVGRHNTPSNCTVQVTGAVQNNPRTQETEFQAWEVNPVDTLGQTFTMTPELYDRLTVFRPERGQSPIGKLTQIADELAENVTHIYGRPLAHIAMDLVWHSPLQFEFNGQMLDRGWLELLVIGDTRTGKSLIAEALIKHYKSGEKVDCEEASMAGVVGGVQQVRNEWMVTWGVLPVNDRRLCVLDEISGLSIDDIGQMSGVRASGVASIDKVVSEKTYARTRKVWIGNPREDLTMSDYAFGIYAIKPLIGRSEDIARFDLAMTMKSTDVDVERYLMQERTETSGVYTQDRCSELVRWVWTREPGDVVWEDGAEDEVLKQASALGQNYIATPPLILRQDVRIKVARVAAAIAARLFSTRDGEEVYVRRTHVRAAARFIDELYSADSFGYRYLSDRARRDSTLATANIERAWKLIKSNPGLASFLLTRPEGRFFARDLEEVLNMAREGANSVINGLLNLKMLTKDRGFVKISPELAELLREKER
jgi:hypothetical protein